MVSCPPTAPESAVVHSNHSSWYQWAALACRGDFGRLGHGDIMDVFLPKPVAALSGIGVQRLACGDTHTLAMTASGRLFSFGRNQNGQLGLGTDRDSMAPVEVEALQVKPRASRMRGCHGDTCGCEVN